MIFHTSKFINHKNNMKGKKKCLQHRLKMFGGRNVWPYNHGMVHICSTHLWCPIDASRLVSDTDSYCINMKKKTVSDSEKGLWH